MNYGPQVVATTSFREIGVSSRRIGLLGTVLSAVIATSWLSACDAGQEGGTESAGYRELDVALRDVSAAAGMGDAGVEVVEIFSYACPHCYRLATAMEVWQRDKAESIAFRRVVVGVGKLAEDPYETAFHVAAIRGIAAQVHLPLFELIHAVPNTAGGRNLASFRARAAELLGVSVDEYARIASSDEVAGRLARDREYVRARGIAGVPTIVVGDRYWTAPIFVEGDHGRMLRVVEELVERLRRQSGSH